MRKRLSRTIAQSTAHRQTLAGRWSAPSAAFFSVLLGAQAGLGQPAPDPAPGPEEVEEPAPPETGPPAGEPVPAADGASELGSTSTPESQGDSPPPGDADARRDAEIAQLKAELEELRQRQDEAEVNSLAEEDVEVAPQDVFAIYGFMDVGAQYIAANKRSIVSAYFDTNAATFVLGNIDLYFDFNPHPDWRALAEIRFTNAPHGLIDNFGGLAGDFSRRNTQQFDPHASVVNAPMWGGYTVIERAWIEWKRFQSLQIRTGSFFTPFGIWNVDHGTPTLISLAMPQFIQQTYFPLRQVGVQALGSFFVKDYELAYRAWISNGRQELSNVDFTSDKAFGARLFLARRKGTTAFQAGSSFHHGRVADKAVDITSGPPLSETVTFDTYETWAYKESVFGADFSLDISKFRFRTEYTSQLRLWDEGKREPLSAASPVPGAVEPDSWRHSAYVLFAYELPWGGIEPYFYSEIQQQAWDLPDGLIQFSPGFNWRFNPAAQFKFQTTFGKFFDWKEEAVGENLYNTTTVMGRLVLAF